MTKVVNIFHNEPFDIYIGRRGHGYDGYFGNPYRIDLKSGYLRSKTIFMFRKYFRDRLKRDPEYKRRVLELRGKTLGCFCKPYPCHGDIIAEWLDKFDS